jgi:thiol:disulfide interchange protein DsbA
VTKHKTNPVNTVRNLIIGVVAAVALIVGGYGVFYSAGGGASGEFKEGEHFTLIEGAAEVDADASIVVTEFFSYYCVHCRNFDPIVEDWREQVPDGVEFERSPVAFSPIWELLGQTYYVLRDKGALAENHDRLFRAIHDNGKQFLSPDMLADFIGGHGISSDEFTRAFNSPTVRREMGKANQRARDLGIRAVPTLVVADRYMVETARVGRRNAFDVVEFLIEKIRAPEVPQT